MDDGAVENLELVRTPSGAVRVTGTVYGSYAHPVSFVVDPAAAKIVSYDCDCRSSEAGPCKHVVALGMAASRRSVVAESKKASPKRIAARVVVPVSPRLPEHAFHRIELAFSYDRARDLIRLNATAVYGPFVYPLEGSVPLRGSEDPAALPLRDAAQEREARKAIERYGFHQEEPGLFEMPAEHAFYFLRDGYLALSSAYTVLADDAFASLAEIQRQDVASTWEISDTSGEDWLSFSVDWAVGGRPLTPDEIERLANGYTRFIRAEDGTFVEIGNREELRRVLALTEGQEKTRGKHLSRARALELALLAEQTAGVRLGETTDSLRAFLRDAKEGKLVEEPNIPSEIAGVLRPYQRDAVAWALFLRKYQFGGVLADDMGLGKTLQALATIVTERPANAPPSLVICPKTLIPVWLAEAKRFTPELRVHAMEGTAKERAALVSAGGSDLLVTSYSLFQRDVKLYRAQTFYYVILDEAQYVKNASSVTATAVKTIQAQHRLALTGTPLENGVHELWSLFDFLMPGLLDDHATFRRRFEKPIRDRADAEALAALKRRVKPFLLRRTKESVAPELPPRIEQTDLCPLAEPQAALYADVLSRVREDIFAAVRTKGFSRSQIDILSALTRLRQVCNHPALVDPQASRREEASGKMAYALELVREAIDGGHKVLLFSQFTSMLDLLRDALDGMGISHQTIEGKTRDRAAVVEQFRAAEGGTVFLLSLRAAGTGLTLTEADTVILYDPWWNPMVERQAMDRAHRIGQTKAVNVHKLVTKGTIEERVLSLQEKKKAVFDAVVSETADGMKGLTWEDVQGLFEG